MNIALVILHADPARGGAERYTLDLASSLRALGHNVTLLASSFANIPPSIHTVPLAHHGLTRTARYNRFLDSLDAHLAHTPYDIVHAMLPVRRCDLYHPHAGVAACSLSPRERAGVRASPHSGILPRAKAHLSTLLNPRRRRFAQVEHALLTSPHPPIVLCLSNYIKSAVTRHYPLPSDRLFMLMNGIDTTRFDPATPLPHPPISLPPHLPTDPTLALLVAQDFDRKGLRPAIHALAALNDPRLVLLVVGRDNPAPYQRLARQLNIADRIIFAGPTADTRPYYAAADFFVLPTRHDPCSLVVLEALAMGLPVISTAQNGACEVMAEGQEGFILPDPSDIPALASAMQSLLDPARRKSMRRAALALRPTLSQQHHVNKLLEAYALAKSRTTSPA